MKKERTLPKAYRRVVAPMAFSGSAIERESDSKRWVQRRVFVGRRDSRGREDFGGAIEEDGRVSEVWGWLGSKAAKLYSPIDNSMPSVSTWQDFIEKWHGLVTTYVVFHVSPVDLLPKFWVPLMRWSSPKDITWLVSNR